MNYRASVLTGGTAAVYGDPVGASHGRSGAPAEVPAAARMAAWPSVRGGESEQEVSMPGSEVRASEWADAAAAVRQVLAQQIAAGRLVGAQYLAVTAEQTRVDLHVGVTDAATAQPLQRQTWQMAYSITKAVTAIAALRLVDAGALSLDAPLSRYFAEHPYGEAVLVRQLLAHTAGIPSPAPLAWFTVPGEAADRRQRLRALLAASPRLCAAPGSEYRYSNLGYWLLEEVIEAASGMDFAQYVQQQVFGLVGSAEQTGFAPDAARMAIGHTTRWGLTGLVLRALTPRRYWIDSTPRWRRAAPVRPFGRAYGGLFCSAAALAPLLADLLQPRPRLLSPAAREQLFAAQQIRTGKPTGDALGWACGSLDRVGYRGKQGGGLGFHGNVRVYPDLGLATVLLANITEVTAGPIDQRSDQLDRLVMQKICS